MRLWSALAIPLAVTISCDDGRARADQELSRDRTMLEAILASDLELDRAMKKADDLSAKGDDAAAADALATLALPRADATLVLVRASTPTTAWGKERQREWLALAEDRKIEIPRYAQALRGDDIAAKLAALEAQANLQKRAMKLAAAVKAGPDGRGGAG